MTDSQPPIHPVRRLARALPPVRWTVGAHKRAIRLARRGVHAVLWRAEAARCDTEFKLANAEVLRGLQRTPDARWAVVLHLFYTDTWDFFLERLQRLEGETHDLFACG